MYDYGLSVMEQYGLTVKNSYRGRGALMCQTNDGFYILRPFNGSRKRLEKQQELLGMLHEEEGLLVDAAICTREGELVSTDSEGNSYVLRFWYEGKECDTRTQEDVLRSVEGLAQLHKAMHMPVIEDYVEEGLDTVYVRHNRELRKIQKFIRKKKVSNCFEREYLNSVEEFLAWGEEALEELGNSSYASLRARSLAEGRICHGEFNQHHILLGQNYTAITGFDKWKYDIQVTDLYCFMRKILEKCNWNPVMGKRMLKAYERYRPLSEEEFENLKLRFSYPEKYWKLANYYYSHNKAWISEKNVEKLRILMKQKKTWREFVHICFDTYD